MPQDRTPMSHGLAHPQPERGRIPQPKPRVDDDRSELVPNQQTTDYQPPAPDGKPADAVPSARISQPEPRRAPGGDEPQPQPTDGAAYFVQTPDAKDF